MKKILFGLVFFALGIFIYLTIDKQKNINSQNLEICVNDTVVNLRQGKLLLNFNKSYEEISKNKIIIEVIRDGRVFEKLKYIQKNGDTEVELKKPNLYIKDSLKITFSNNKFVYIHGFKNEVEYANKKTYLGCFLTYYKIDNQEEVALRDRVIINIL